MFNHFFLCIYRYGSKSLRASWVVCSNIHTLYTFYTFLPLHFACSHITVHEHLYLHCIPKPIYLCLFSNLTFLFFAATFVPSIGSLLYYIKVTYIALMPILSRSDLVWEYTMASSLGWIVLTFEQLDFLLMFGDLSDVWQFPKSILTLTNLGGSIMYWLPLRPGYFRIIITRTIGNFKIN